MTSNNVRRAGFQMKVGRPGRPSMTRLVSPRLLWKLDTSGEGKGQLSSPTDIAFLPNRQLAVAELDAHRIQIFNENGNSVKILASGKIKPRGIAIEKEGDKVRVVIVDVGDNTIKKVCVESEEVTSWPVNMFENPSGIAITSDGNYVITDTTKNPDKPKVIVCQPDGKVKLELGSSNPKADDYLVNPNYVSVDHYNQIIVADKELHCLKAFGQTGSLLLTFGEGTLKSPHGVFADNVDNIMVCDNGNHRVSLYSAGGHYIQDVLNEEDQVRWPEGLAVSDGGKMAITENSSLAVAVKVYQV